MYAAEGLHYHLSSPIENITLGVGGVKVELMGEDIRPFLQGPDFTCEGVDTWDVPLPKDVLEELCRESGMMEDEELMKMKEEMNEEMEISEAYELWLLKENGSHMNDLHEPSYFLEWNQGEGNSTWVGGSELHKSTKIPQYTPEMLFQRETLNYFFNFRWNPGRFPGYPNTRFEEIMTVPDQIELLELVSVGENYGIAKCDFGAVFVPKSALGHLSCNGGATVGTIFDGEITFSNEGKFPWRLKKDGVTFTYEDLCGTRRDDDY